MLDRTMTKLCKEWLPNMKEYVCEEGKLIVKLDKAMHGLIQSTKLWYNEMSGFLINKGIKKHPTDECIFIKQMTNGKYVLALLYINDILVMLELKSDRDWVEDILEQRYGKITVIEGQRLPYLGITIIRTRRLI
jgi:hypothetical protein